MGLLGWLLHVKIVKKKMIKEKMEGKKAPDFRLKDKDGKVHQLSNSNFFVIYFYPKDNTPGCTIEANQFNSKLKEFEKLDVQIIGISGGDEKSKTKFCEKHGLKILLLSDTDFAVSKKFGVYGEKLFMGRKYMGINRVTFILDRKRKVIKIFEKVKPAAHAEEVLEFIKSVRSKKGVRKMTRVVHFDFEAEEPEKIVPFYEKAFGWRFEKWDGPMDYWLITTGKGKTGINGGMSPKNQGVACNTIGVTDIDKLIKRIKQNGGNIINEKMAIPGVGWIAYFKDPEGNTWGIMQDDVYAK